MGKKVNKNGKVQKKIQYIPMQLIFILMLTLFLITCVTIVTSLKNDQEFIQSTNKSVRDSFDDLVISSVRTYMEDFETREEFENSLLSSGISDETGHLNVKLLINTSNYLSYGIGSNKKDEYVLTQGLLKYYDEYSNEVVIEDFTQSELFTKEKEENIENVESVENTESTEVVDENSEVVN